MQQTTLPGRPHPILGWVRNLLRRPVEPYGDYYELLRAQVESSAPLCGSCR
jgi:hypothetical protein